MLQIYYPICTNNLATWKILRGKKRIQPDEVVKLLYMKYTFVKKATQDTLENKKSKADAKKYFE